MARKFMEMKEAIIMKKMGMALIGALALGIGLPVMAAAPSAAAATALGQKLTFSLDYSSSGSTDTFMALIPVSESGLRPVFQFWANNGHGWKMVQNYSSKYTYQMPASQAQGTVVIAFAMSAAQWQVHDYGAATYRVCWADPNASVSLSVPPAPVVGTTYTLTASQTSVPNATYQLWIENPSGKWTSSGAYQTSANFSWKPLTNGLFHFAIYAKDRLLPAYSADEVSSSASVSTIGQPTRVLFGSALPVVPINGTKVLTATVLDAQGNAVTTYSGPVTLSVQSNGAFSVKGASSAVTQGTVTIDAVHGQAHFTVAGGSKIGASGTVAVTAPFHTLSTTLTDVSNSASAQAGYGFFNAQGQRISYAHPLSTVGGSSYSSSPQIPVTLKPLSAFGTPVSAGFTDDVTLEPYTPQSEPSSVVPYYQGTAVQCAIGSNRGSGTEFVDVKAGTTAISLDFHPGSGGLDVLSATPRPLIISAQITALIPPLGMALTPTAMSKGKATVAGVKPDTTYKVTAVPAANGSPIAPSAMLNLTVPNLGVAILSSGPRTTASMVSVPTWNAEKGDWTLTYISGSSANASDTLAFSNGLESLTTNLY